MIVLYEGMTYDECRDIFGNLIEELLDRQFFVKRGEAFILRFVGLVVRTVQGKAYKIYCLPKYLRNRYQGELTESQKMHISELMGQILRVVELTPHSHDFLADAVYDENKYQKDKKKISFYDLAKWIVKDYCENGIYFFKQKTYTSQNKGHISWGKTIAKKIPIISRKDTVYTDLISAYSEKKYDNEISDIQRCVVAEAIEKLTELGEAVDVEIPDYDKSLRGLLKKYVSVIQKYQRIVFTNRDISLLRALEAWCDNETYYYLMPCRGTVSFELVWEDVIREVYGHRELTGKVGFGAPLYHLIWQKKPYEREGDSIPDALNFWAEDGKIRFLVLDGKYYLGNIDIKKNKIKDFPGYKDVAKQIDYYDTLVKVYGLDVNTGCNVFVMPYWEYQIENDKDGKSDDGAMRYIGYVEKPGAKDPIRSIIKKLSAERSDENAAESGEAGQNTTESNTETDSREANIVHLIQIHPEALYKLFFEKHNREESAKEMYNFVKKSHTEC
ncbi:MAG: LlaJI family restriction endonuclease [Lachnospiraceae bacterium]|nr:LlaJI family restriction endonuclease [Lachnospiraceae bacterium]